MYDQNLTQAMVFRLSPNDMDFLRDLSSRRAVSVSECLRSIIGEYRRSFEMLDMLTKSITLSNAEKEDNLSDGDTETYFNN